MPWPPAPVFGDIVPDVHWEEGGRMGSSFYLLGLTGMWVRNGRGLGISNEVLGSGISACTGGADGPGHGTCCNPLQS